MFDVVLDPGHGGSLAEGKSTPYGCPVPPGRDEKDVNLELARAVRAQLPGSRLTRLGDHNLSLSARGARGEGSDVFVSIHGAPPGGPPSVWVHPRAGAPARDLGDRLARAVGAPAVRADAPMAVLAPERLGGSCAACLVEADLSRLGGSGVHEVGRSIASAIRAHGRSYGMASDVYGDGYGDGYFTDTDQLTDYMRDQRGHDDRRVSSIADAEAVVDGWVRRRRPSVWSHMNATDVGNEIKARCRNHRLFRQGNLNLCGPAALLMCWAGRDPVAYARYAIGMIETGVGRLGSQTIRASDALKGLRYPRLGNPNRNMTTPAADFLAMAPIRNDANAILPYDGSRSGELLAGLTRPEELASWMRAAGAWSRVRDEANWARTRGYDHAMGLSPGGGEDIALLINVNALSSARRVQNLDNKGATNPFTPDNTFILDQFPNHFVVLLAEMVPDTSARTLSMSVWTWGGSYTFEGVPLRRFMENYYGAVRGTTRR